MSDQRFSPGQIISGVNTSVGAVQVVVASWDLSNVAQSQSGEAPNNCAIIVMSRLSGYVISGSLINNVACRALTRGFLRVGGVLTALGATAGDLGLALAVSDVGLATVTTDIIIVGNIIQLVATGVANQNLRWLGDITVHINQPT